MELYSRNPPSIAPNRFEERATATEADFLNSAEKANPEKKRGSVSTIVIIARLSQGVKPLRLAETRYKPAIKEPHKSGYVTKG